MERAVGRSEGHLGLLKTALNSSCHAPAATSHLGKENTMNDSQHASHERDVTTMTECAKHGDASAGRHSHGLIMLACCIPVLLIAVVLVAAHVVNASAIVFALGCILMMAFMMRGMNHGGGEH